MNEQTFREETQYLAETMEALRQRIGETLLSNEDAHSDFDEQSKYLWEEVEAYYAEGERGFDRLGEMLTNLEELNVRVESQAALAGLLRRYRRMLMAPYFARIDFRESPDSPTYEGDFTENIYIGRASLTDGIIDRVYDWRTPIASLFYRAEQGKASFDAPIGKISGDVTLKRQYIIKNGKLNLYVDSDLRVADEMLAGALSRASTGKMHSVVETIQARQDEIIRDTSSEILLVQGAAGSGKTAVALHRVAFLLYDGQAQKLSANDVLMLSPSALFGDYVADVLPELGEEQLRTMLYEELAAPQLPELQFSSRLIYLDALVNMDDSRAACYDFLGSESMTRILDRAADRYARRDFDLYDIWYNNSLIMSREEQREYLLRNPFGLPAGERLLRFADQIFERIDEMKEARRHHIALMISADPSRVDPEKDASAILTRELAEIRRRIIAQLTMDSLSLFHRVLADDTLFASISAGTTLPEGFDSFRHELADTLTRSRSGQYETVAEASVDFPTMCAALYLQVRLFGGKGYEKLRQLVIDEAQDVSFLQFATLAKLSPYARVTAVGDPAQSLSDGTDALFDTLMRLYSPRCVTSIKLDKSYRSTAPITAFCNTLTDTPAEVFSREGEEPRITDCTSESDMFSALSRDIAELSQRYPGIAVIAPDSRTAQEYKKLLPDAALLTEASHKPAHVTIIPVALSKGLEFDAVLVPHMERYTGSRGRRALYVACTRALHILRLYRM